MAEQVTFTERGEKEVVHCLWKRDLQLGNKYRDVARTCKEKIRKLSYELIWLTLSKVTKTFFYTYIKSKAKVERSH